MFGHPLRTAIISRRLAYLACMLCACVPRMAWSQTPSPLQEWQYPGGTILEKLYEPNLQDWRVVLGAAVAAMPRYDGAQSYRESPGPVIVILYRDIAFASVGEGLGVNLLRGDKYRAGVALGYDVGRPMSDEYHHLHGLGDINPAPSLKVFGTYVISKEFALGKLSPRNGASWREGLGGRYSFRGRHVRTGRVAQVACAQEAVKPVMAAPPRKSNSRMQNRPWVSVPVKVR